MLRLLVNNTNNGFRDSLLLLWTYQQGQRKKELKAFYNYSLSDNWQQVGRPAPGGSDYYFENVLFICLLKKYPAIAPIAVPVINHIISGPAIK